MAEKVILNLDYVNLICNDLHISIEELANEIVDGAKNEPTHNFKNTHVYKKRLVNYFKLRTAKGNVQKEESKVTTGTLDWITDGLVIFNQEHGTHKGKYLPGCDKYTSKHAISKYMIKGNIAYIPSDILPSNNMTDEEITSCRMKYLFGADISEGVTKEVIFHLTSEWGGLPLIKPDNDSITKLRELANKIINESLVHPLYFYLYGNMSKNGVEARTLLQHSVIFTTTTEGIGVSVLPPVSATLNWITKTLSDIVCPARIYTQHDFLTVAGHLARKASERDDYSITDADIDSLEKEYANINGIKQIKNDILNFEKGTEARNIQWTIVEDNARKFKIRLYRLILTAIKIAEEKNFYLGSPESITFSSILSVENIVETHYQAIVDDLYNTICSKIPKTKGDHVHIDYEFDDIVMFTTALILSLNANLADRLIEKLCHHAYDYRVEVRDTQIALIYILSYLLCDNVPMTAKRRSEVFKAAYSRTIYRLEQTEINRIFSTSRFYTHTVAEALSDACTFTDEGNKTKGQPDYIFLYNYVDPDNTDTETEKGRNFLKKACKFRSSSWYGENADEDMIQLKDIKKALDELKKTEDKKNIMYYAYGMQMLGYRYANEKSDSHIHPKLSNEIDYDMSAKEQFLLALILADYYCRLYNHYYSEKCTNHSAMFLVCGTHRAICTGFLSNIKVSIDAAIYKQYMNWFNKEHGRYQFMVGKLLMHISIKDDCQTEEDYQTEIYSVLCNQLINNPPVFMKYDKIYPEELLNHCSQNDKPRFLSELKLSKKEQY